MSNVDRFSPGKGLPSFLKKVGFYGRPWLANVLKARFSDHVIDANITRPIHNENTTLSLLNQEHKFQAYASHSPVFAQFNTQWQNHLSSRHAHSEYVAPNFDKRAGSRSQTNDLFGWQKIIVALRPGADASVLCALRKDVGAQLEESLQALNFEIWSRVNGPFSLEQVNQIRQSEGIQSVVRDDEMDVNILSTYYPNDPNFQQSLFNRQWGLQNTGYKEVWDAVYTRSRFDVDIDAPEAWTYVKSLATEPQETIVAVFDTGVDWLNPDLQSRMWTNPREIAGNGIDDDQNGYIDDIRGYDFGNNDADPMDRDGHGTHVAGIIAAAHNNSTGITGVNPYAKIMAIKIADDNGKFASVSAIARAIDYAIANGATIGNHSWGGNYPRNADVDILELAIKRAGDAGMLTIMAAANDTDNNDINPYWPANISLPETVSVASLTALGSLSGFSNYGTTKVNIAAPGSDIYSTWLRDKGYYKSISGTSMAAPMVAGVASLVKSVYPNLSPSQLKARILDGSDKNEILTQVVSSGGSLNAFRALQWSDADPLPKTIDFSAQWRAEDILYYATSSEFDSQFIEGPEMSGGSAVRAAGGSIGNRSKDTVRQIHLFDIPAFKQPFSSVKVRIPLARYGTPDSTETIEIRTISALSVPEIQNLPYRQLGSQSHQNLAGELLLGSLSISFPTPGSGSLNQWYTLDVGASGLAALNALRAAGGGEIATSMALKDLRAPSTPYGFVEYESLQLSSDFAPEIVFEFDPLPSLAITPISLSKAEGSNGLLTAYTFTVTRSGNRAASSSVRWTVSGKGTIPASSADFRKGIFPSGIVSFAAGETRKSFSVYVNADRVVESNESFKVILSNPKGATISTAVASGTIQNDDTSLAITPALLSKAEGSTGLLTSYKFKVVRSGNIAVNSSAAWSVSGNGSLPAAATDFQNGNFPSGTVSFAAGETSKTLSVNVTADPAVESNESFKVTLSNPTGGTISTPVAAGTILNDDGTSLSITPASASKQEGSAAGLTPYSFTVTRSGNTAARSSVQWMVSGAGTKPAASSDFENGIFPSGTVAFAAGETSKTFSVKVNADLTAESNESFKVTLSNPTGGTITTPVAVGMILNDDAKTKTSTFANVNPISINNEGYAAPYPASIVVDGLTGVIVSASVTLYGLSHTFPDDIDAVLLSPTGIGVLLMSDAGGGTDIQAANLTFADNAAARLADAAPINSGTYKPTNWQDASEPNGDFSVLYSESLAGLSGASPNGSWGLYIRDDAAGDGGTLTGGWSLQLVTA